MDDAEEQTYTKLKTSNARKLLLNPVAYETKNLKIELREIPLNFCTDCHRSFKSKIEYINHTSESHDHSRKYSCDICKADFSRRAHLDRHINSVHDPKYSNCPVCFKPLKRQDLLNQHIRDIHPDRNDIYHCRNCDFTCANMKELQNHEITHETSGRHQCPHCNNTFKRRDHMVRHIKCAHMNQFVVCPICQQKYKRKDHVARHIREKH